MSHGFDPDDVARARLVLHVELLTELVAQMLGEHARNCVGRASGRGWNNDPHWVFRIIRLRMGGTADRQQSRDNCHDIPMHRISTGAGSWQFPGRYPTEDAQTEVARGSPAQGAER